MIKATMVTPNMTLGGAERWIVDLIKHSNPSKLQWTGVAVSGFGGADKSLTSELSKFCPLYTQSSGRLGNRPSHALPFCCDHFKMVESQSFRDVVNLAAKDSDVVVTWGSPRMANWFSDLNIPRVLCAHTTQQEPELYPIEGITHLAAVSELSMNYFKGRENFDKLPRRVIYNGSDPERVMPRTNGRQRMRKLWGAKSSEVVIGYLGRQTAEKNPFAAALATQAGGERFKAVYYGWSKSGRRPDRRLTGWCEQMIPGRCNFYPPTPAIGDVLAGIDVFMLASTREAFSLGLIEAWLAAKPVVATPVGSVPELTQKFGDLVYQVPVSPSPVDLIEAVELAHADKLRVQRAFSVATEHFTVNQMTRNWERYLEDIVRGHA